MRVLLVAIALTGAAATDCVPANSPYNFETMQPTNSPTPQG